MTNRKIDVFIEGLQIMRDKVVSTSFYNSSGDSVYFRAPGLTSAEKSRLKELGWSIPCEEFGQSPDFGFTEWWERERQ